MEIIGIIVWCIIWGIVTDKIIKNKGYTENWFWWGFFFGLIAVIVAAAKPTKSHANSSFPIEEKKADAAVDASDEEKSIKMMKEYKELLDSGVITQEEFEQKKAKILNINQINDNAEVSQNNDDNEIVIKEGLCNRIKKGFVQNGHGTLTNKRFIYSKHSIAKIVAVGMLVNLTKGSYEFEIAISDIKEIKDGRHGFSDTIIICTKSGEEYNFYFTDRQIWKIEFENLIAP